MEITVRGRHGTEIEFKFDNVTVTEDAEERVYPKDENGKTDWSKCERDVSTGVLDAMTGALTDLITYRKKPYDPCHLVTELFEKMTPELRAAHLKELNESYGEWKSGWMGESVTCDLCTHNWVAVYPSECTELECPNCGHMTPAPHIDGENNS